MDREIKEESESSSSPLLRNPPNKSGPEIEVHLYRRGKGPIGVFRSGLGGYEQDQLEVGDICDKFGFKSVYAFGPDRLRGAPIRFNPKNGLSLLPYTDGSVIVIDGEPKDSLLKPFTKILIGLAVTTFMIVLVMKENPKWMEKLNFSGGRVPPWVLACAVIVFTRMRKRTKDFFQNRAGMGEAAQKAEVWKMAKYEGQCATNGLLFRPFVLKSTDGFGLRTDEVINRLVVGLASVRGVEPAKCLTSIRQQLTFNAQKAMTDNLLMGTSRK